MKKFLLLVFVIAVPAAYGDQIDQSLTLTSLLPRDGFISGAMDALTPPILTAQTFTAGLTGNLTGVSVLVVQPSNVQMPVADVQVGIYNTANGIPLGSPLFTTTINPKSSGGTVGGATVLLGDPRSSRGQGRCPQARTDRF